MRVLIAGWPNSPHVIASAEAVARAGHEVHIVGRVPPEWPPPKPDPNVHSLGFDGLPVVRSIRMSHELARVVAEVKPDLVHAHWLPEFGWMAAREGIRPLICSAWGSDVFGVSGIARRRSIQALAAADALFADSAHLARATRDLAGRDVPVEIVRWGLDLERFAPGDKAAARQALGLQRDGPLIVSVRGFRPIYNPELQLDAFARVRERWPAARLLFKYPADDVPRAVSLSIKRLGLEGAVTTLANVPAEHMPDVYRAADVVLSVPSTDSSPRSVWEALACGRSVVVSDLPWAQDELEDGRNALLTPLDATAVSNAIERALGDEGLGREGRALAEAELDEKACTARIDEVYRSVVAGARRRTTNT